MIEAYKEDVRFRLLLAFNSPPADFAMNLHAHTFNNSVDFYNNRMDSLDTAVKETDRQIHMFV